MCQCYGIKKVTYDSVDALLCRICLAKAKKAIRRVENELHLAISVAENFAQRNRPENVGGATSNVISGAGTPRALSSLSEARLHAPSMPMLTLPGHLSSMAAISTPTIHLNNGTLSRASSRKSLANSEFIYPDTIRQRVTVDDCPVCQILMPKGPHGCVCKTKCFKKI